MNNIENKKEKPWIKSLESFVNDEDSFVIKQKRAQRNIKIGSLKEANSKIYDISEGVAEINRLASFNENNLGVHGFLYDRCSLDLFREFLSNSYFKSQNMKFTARIIYLLDWFVNSLKDDKVLKESYKSLYHKQFNLISQYNDHNDFDRSYAESNVHKKISAVEHMDLIRRDLKNTKSFKNGIKEYDPKDLVKFVISYIYSVLEKDYDTTRKVNEETLPDWLMNFTPSRSTSTDKTLSSLNWDEADDDTIIIENYDNISKALHTIAQFGTYPDVNDSDISSLFEDDDMKIAAIDIFSYIHALMSYGIAIYNSFIAEKLKHLWFNPDCITDYIYSIYQHVRIDEAMIRYSTEINMIAVVLKQCSMSYLHNKLAASPYSALVNTPYNTAFAMPSVPAPSPYPPYPFSRINNPLPHVYFSPYTPNNDTPSQPPYIDMRLKQLEQYCNQLTGQNDELKDRLDKLEALYASKEKQLISKSDKEDSCVHNNYVAYLYNNVYPKIDPYEKGINMEYEKWKSGMSEAVLNYYTNQSYNMSIESDDGIIVRHKCNLCGKHFDVDRRLMSFSTDTDIDRLLTVFSK